MIGLLVKHLRESQDLTQCELAADAGISQPAISQIERGRRIGSISLLSRITAALGVDLSDFLKEL